MIKYWISHILGHVVFHIGDTIGWIEDWRTNSMNESWIYAVAEWFMNQSYWLQEWGGGGPWYSPTDDQIDRMITFDEED